MSKNVPVLTATTRRRPSALGGVEDVLGAVDVHRLEVGQVLAGPAQQGGAVDGRVAAGGAPEDVVGVGDVAGHDLDPQVGQRSGVGSGPGQGPDVVAPLDEELADVGAGQSGGAGDEDRLDSCRSLLRRRRECGVDLARDRRGSPVRWCRTRRGCG